MRHCGDGREIRDPDDAAKRDPAVSPRVAPRAAASCAAARNPGPGGLCRCSAGSPGRPTVGSTGTSGNTSAASEALDRLITVSAAAMMKMSDPMPGGLQRQPNCLRAVPGVDITPEVPHPGGRIGIEIRECRVVSRVHHIRESQPRHRQFRVPPAELAGHLLFESLRQRIRRTRPRVVFLVNRDVRRRRVRSERQPENGLAGCPDHRLDAGGLGRGEDVMAAGDVVDEGGGVGGQPGSRDRGQMNHRVDASYRSSTASSAPSTWP